MKGSGHIDTKDLNSLRDLDDAETVVLEVDTITEAIGAWNIKTPLAVLHLHCPAIGERIEALGTGKSVHGGIRDVNYAVGQILWIHRLLLSIRKTYCHSGNSTKSKNSLHNDIVFSLFIIVFS